MSEPLAAVVHCLASEPSVAAVALVGSRASGSAAAGSDLDLFVYADEDIGALRARLAEELADPAAWRTIQDCSFGDGDVWRLKRGGAWLDLMYWRPAWAEQVLCRLLVEHRAAMGYSTAFWRSIRDARPLYERDAWHPDLQRQARQPYPDALRRNIVRLNRPYLRDHPFSYRQQTAAAIQRRDAVSVNHRVAAWLASYFDVVFAVNRVLHPGEKRQLEFVARECVMVPDGLPLAVEALIELAGRAEPAVLDALDELAAGLDALLQREGLLLH
jgi:hypothetical protein